jgi:hypothetical protein
MRAQEAVPRRIDLIRAKATPIGSIEAPDAGICDQSGD